MSTFSSREQCLKKLNEAGGGKVRFSLPGAEKKSDAHAKNDQRPTESKAKAIQAPPKSSAPTQLKPRSAPISLPAAPLTQEQIMRADPKFMDCPPCTCNDYKCLDCSNDPFFSYHMLIPSPLVQMKGSSASEAKKKHEAGNAKGKGRSG